jgi:hypothetical protein
MRRFSKWCLVIAMSLAAPSAAFGQTSITGVVRDTSGGVLPGVTVEASSPALIEKVRTTVTDASGTYRLVDMRSGTYSVSFTLPGFSVVKRDGIELAGTFTATINIELRVGAVEETITVTGETPIVDVQSVRRQTTIDNETISSIPGSRAYASLMQLMPNTVTQAGSATDTQVVPGMVVFGGAGGRTNEGRLQLDGLSVGSAFNGAGVSAYIADVGNAAEITMTTSGGLGEAETGGPSLNIVPKEGGNRVAGSVYVAGVTKGMIGDNYSDDLRQRGLTTPGRYRKVWDLNLGVGGPIARDRVWFFATVRDEGSDRTVPGMFANANAGDPTKWNYVADTTRPAVVAASYRTTALRLTMQATAKHKFGLFWDEQAPCEGGAAAGFSGSACRASGDNEIFAGSTAPPTPSASATLAPETAAYRDYGQRVRQGKWTAPISSNLLLEGGIGGYRSRYGGTPIPGASTEDLIRVTEQCAPSCANNGSIPNLTYRSGNWSSNINRSVNWRASAAYVLGSKSFKFGYQGAHLTDSRRSFSNAHALTYRVNSAVTAANPLGRPIPNQVTMTIDRFGLEQRVRSDAFYGQGAWTVSRMTVQGALRYDRAWSYFPEQTVGPVRFFPSAVTYPHTEGVTGYNDLTPRAGVALDVFGNGKTSLKFNVGRYLEAAQNGGLFTTNNPTGRLSTSASRAWADTDGDYVVDCDLLNPIAHTTGGDSCGANTNAAFGTPVFDTTQDPALFSGWGIRAGDWQIGAALQQEVLPRVSVEFGYERRWLLNFTATDNLARSPADHSQFGVNIPVDSRLPNGGGGVLDGLYNVTAAAAALVPNNFVTLSGNYGERTQQTNSFNMNLRARTRGGVTVQGGFNTANTHNDFCRIREALPEQSLFLTPFSPTNPWCDTTTGWVTRFTALGSYIVPRVDVLVSATFRSDQGGNLAANWTASNANTVGLNRPFAGTAGQTIVVNLVEPGTLYGDRINEFNLRLAKILRFGRTRTNVGFDVSNVTNSAAVLSYNQTYSPTVFTGPSAWLRPTSVLQPRFVKISAQIDF